jgi:hypothetical protein
MVDLILVRFIFIAFVAFTCYLIHPFGLSPKLDAGVGAVVGLAIVVFEWRLLRVSLKRLIGAAIGSILGILGAYLFALVIRNSLADSSLRSFLQIMVMLLMAYVGLVVGANKGDLLNLAALGGVFGGEKQLKKSCNWWQIPVTRSSGTAGGEDWTSYNGCRRSLPCRFRLSKTNSPAFVKSI